MKRFLVLLISISIAVSSTSGQNRFPDLDTTALVSGNYDIKKMSKPYTVIIYGGVGCSYSKYLLQNLDVLQECKDRCDIVLIMDQPKDSIINYMNDIAGKYPTFTNTILNYRLKKKSDIFPQLLLFKNKVQIEHIVGIKEGMLTNTKKRILEGN